jgi:hypothetical protein
MDNPDEEKRLGWTVSNVPKGLASSVRGDLINEHVAAKKKKSKLTWLQSKLQELLGGRRVG